MLVALIDMGRGSTHTRWEFRLFKAAFKDWSKMGGHLMLSSGIEILGGVCLNVLTIRM